MHRRCHWPGITGIVLLLLLAGCGNTSNNSGTGQKNSGPPQSSSPFPAATTPATGDISTVSFTLRGGVTGMYTIRASSPTSKLRHGYREFTVDVANGDMSIYVAFYGYHGPATYTLSESVNGGDVRINFYRQSVSWDLSLRPEAQCALTIISVTPTPYAGIERMTGAFSCPLLPSSSPSHPLQPVAVSNGHIDVAIIAES